MSEGATPDDRYAERLGELVRAAVFFGHEFFRPDPGDEREEYAQAASLARVFGNPDDPESIENVIGALRRAREALERVAERIATAESD